MAPFKDPFLEEFLEVTVDQKMAIVGILTLIGFSDNTVKLSKPEIKYLKKCAKYLQIDFEDSMALLNSSGTEILIQVLNSLNEHQKLYLVFPVIDFIRTDGPPYDIEIQFSANLFDMIGVEENLFTDLVEKYIQFEIDIKSILYNT